VRVSRGILSPSWRSWQKSNTLLNVVARGEVFV
jgi:hypothetical protein